MDSSITDRVRSLRDAVEYGKTNGKRNLIVDLDLLDLILRGEVPVGGNELPPEEVTARLYEVKKKLADTTRELGFANVRGDQAEALLAALKALGKKWNWDEFIPLDVYFDQGFDELMSARAELARMHAAADTLPNRRNFGDELVCLINKYSRENGSNTPDFILAEYLTDQLETWNKAVRAREEWYGRGFKEGSLTCAANPTGGIVDAP